MQADRYTQKAQEAIAAAQRTAESLDQVDDDGEHGMFSFGLGMPPWCQVLATAG